MRDGIIHGLSADIIRAVRVRRMSVPVAEAEFIRAVCTSESSRLVRFSHALMQPRWSQVQRRAVAYVVNDSNQEFTILTSLMPRPLIDAALDTSVQGPALRDTCSVPSLNAAHPRTLASFRRHPHGAPLHAVAAALRRIAVGDARLRSHASAHGVRT